MAEAASSYVCGERLAYIIICVYNISKLKCICVHMHTHTHAHVCGEGEREGGKERRTTLHNMYKISKLLL